MQFPLVTIQNYLPTPPKSFQQFWAGRERQIEICSGATLAIAGARFLAASALISGVSLSILGIGLIAYGFRSTHSPAPSSTTPDIPRSEEATPPEPPRINPKKVRFDLGNTQIVQRPSTASIQPIPQIVRVDFETMRIVRRPLAAPPIEHVMRPAPIQPEETTTRYLLRIPPNLLESIQARLPEVMSNFHLPEGTTMTITFPEDDHPSSPRTLTNGIQETPNPANIAVIVEIRTNPEQAPQRPRIPRNQFRTKLLAALDQMNSSNPRPSSRKPQATIEAAPQIKYTRPEPDPISDLMRRIPRASALPFWIPV